MTVTTATATGAGIVGTALALDVIVPAVYAAAPGGTPTLASAPVTITPGAAADRIYAWVTVISANWDTSYNSLTVTDSTGDTFTQVGAGVFIGPGTQTSGSIHLFECQLTHPGVAHNLTAAVNAPFQIVGIRIKPISVRGVASMSTPVTQLGLNNVLSLPVPSGPGHLVLFGGAFPSTPAAFAPASSQLELSGPVSGGYATYLLSAAAPGAATVTFADTTSAIFGAIAVDLVPGVTGGGAGTGGGGGTIFAGGTGSGLVGGTPPPTPDGSTVTFGELIVPCDGVLLPPGASSPLTGDTGIVAGLPSPTGKAYAQWDAGVYNLQSQHWLAAPAAATDGSRSACQNVTTPRVYGTGPLVNKPVGSYYDINFQTDSPHVTALYYFNNAYSARLYHDMHWLVGDGDELSQVTAYPATSPGGLGWYSRTLTFREARMQDHRILLPGDAIFAGVYIDTPYQIAPTADKWLFAVNGDSWNEAAGGVLASPMGGAYPTGTYEVMNLTQSLILAWGCAVIPIAQFGTGRFVANNFAYSSHTYNNLGTTTFEGDARIADYAAKFGSSGATILTIGGWNDAAFGGAPYHDTYMTEAQRGIDAWQSAIPGVQLIYAGIQPGDISGPADIRYLSNQGLKDACASRPANVAGFVDILPLWYDLVTGWTGTTWPGFGSPPTLRSNNVNPADELHLTVKGANMAARWLTDRMRHISINRAYVEAQRA